MIHTLIALTYVAEIAGLLLVGLVIYGLGAGWFGHP
jgi:hypothetical protein